LAGLVLATTVWIMNQPVLLTTATATATSWALTLKQQQQQQQLLAASRNKVAMVPNNKEVSYQIVPKSAVAYTNVDRWDSCAPKRYCNKFGRHCQERNSLFPELQRLTNFSTTLNLGTNSGKLLVLGDSVAMQFFEMLDRASSASRQHNQTIIEYAFGDHLSYGVSGDRKLGAWRTTGMFLNRNEGKLPPNSPEGGWNRTTAQALLHIPIHHHDSSGGAEHAVKQHQEQETIGSFEVVMFRIAHGWLELNQIDIKGIRESLQVAHEVFGVTKAIILTMPFINNVYTHILQSWRRLNDQIRGFVTSFKPNKTIPGIERLVLMDLAELTNQFIQHNARFLGYLNGTDDDEKMPYMDVRLIEFIPKVYPAAAHVCSGPLAKKGVTRILCDKNAITADGLHVCPTTYGGRFTAATGCLLQCLDIDGDEEYSKIAQECQTKCNSKYMTLMPITTA
jgi:hypothetical protein